MQNKKQTTQEKILYAAKAEFLEKGFQTASLRTIVKEAGVTTGALYGYYGSKEAIFDELVEECYTHFHSAYRNALDDFDRLPIEQQPERMSTVVRPVWRSFCSICSTIGKRFICFFFVRRVLITAP